MVRQPEDLAVLRTHQLEVALGRLAQDLELVALRAAGASSLRIAKVPLLLGVLVTALGLPLAHFAEPYGLQALQRRLVDVGLRNHTRAWRTGFLMRKTGFSATEYQT